MRPYLLSFHMILNFHFHGVYKMMIVGITPFLDSLHSNLDRSNVETNHPILFEELNYSNAVTNHVGNRLLHVGLHGYSQSISFSPWLLPECQSPIASAMVCPSK
jgi:hypothetical protein